MADNTLAVFDNLMYELRGPMQKNYRKQHVLHAELERRAPRALMTGDEVRVPVVLNSLQGGGNPGETGTINQPQALNTTKALIGVEDVVQPFSLSLDLEEQSVDNAAAEALALLVTEARNSLAEIVNDQFNATGALLATVTGGSSPGLTVNVSATATQWDRLYPGRIVDVLTRSSGADAGQGKRRKIASIDESAGTVTFDTAQTASDGGSGNITFSANSGIYIAGTYGNAISSLQDIASTTLTDFQGIDKTAVAGWQGVDGRGGDTTSKALTDEIMDGAVRRGRRNGGFVWSFAMGDPAAIDLYKQGKYALVRYDNQPMTLQSGFSGIVYDGADKPIPLIKEDRFEPGQVILVPVEDLKLYGKGSGPEFVADDGAMFRRFSRTLPKEAWLRDKLQLVALRCNRVVKIGNLASAS